MRNPLNSIINLTKDLQSRIEEINEILRLDEEENRDNEACGVLRYYIK